MDEFLRYRMTTLRNSDGMISRVVPNVVDLLERYDRAVLQHQPLYLLRLLESEYYYQILLPRFREEFYGSSAPVGDFRQIMSPQRSADPARTHTEQINYFRTVLAEMLHRLTNHVGSSKLILTQHPHYLHLNVAPPDDRYNQVLASILREEADRLSVRYYNAFSQVNALPRNEISRLYRWPEDPFSHLTQEGYQRFGAYIADYVNDSIDGAINAAQHRVTLTEDTDTCCN
jgi:hypothetical protein